MDEERYVCMKCQRAYSEPDICSACKRGDLLDMRIPSERELLEGVNIRRGSGIKVLGLLALFIVTLFGASFGIGWIGQNWLGLSAYSVEFLAMSTLCLLYLVTTGLLVITQAAYPDNSTISEQETGHFEEVTDDLGPLSEVKEEEQRKAARRRQRHKL